MSPVLPREERDAIRAEAAALIEDPEFESSLHIGGMEQALARFVLDRVPALLAALDAARAETEQYRRNEVTLTNELSRARQDAKEFCGQRDEARAALAASREQYRDLDTYYPDLWPFSRPAPTDPKGTR